ncbi:hypothetical protein KAR48_19210, partial [bacterium]|nr:hypothetical protein [bacterium]
TRMQALKTGDDTEYSISMKLCDSHFLDVYGIELLAGTFFVNNHGDFDHPNWVLNEEALKSLNVTNPHDIIGEEITINGQRGPVLGVVKNFHTFSLREGMMPVVLTNSMFWAHRRAHIRLDGIDLTESLKYIRETWEQSYPGEPFDYFFFDQDIQSRYASEARTLRLIQVASSLAIGIGCLGLLGLVAFVLAQRTKEIGIRKVLGASVNSLYYIIAKDFVKWILAANLISWPVAWYISREWLNGYAYRMTLNVGVFIMGSAMILGVALIVISFQVIKASRSNPINALKYE